MCLKQQELIQLLRGKVYSEKVAKDRILRNVSFPWRTQESKLTTDPEGCDQTRIGRKGGLPVKGEGGSAQGQQKARRDHETERLRHSCEAGHLKVTVDQRKGSLKDTVLGCGLQWFGKWVGGEGVRTEMQTGVSEGSAVNTQTSLSHVRLGHAGPTWDRRRETQQVSVWS